MITVVVRDTPQPQGSKRAFAVRKAGAFTGSAVVVDDNKPGLRNWREVVRAEVQRAVDTAGKCPDPQCGDSTWDHDCQLGPEFYPLEGPVILAVTFTVPKPKSAPKTRVTWPERKPDVDKLLRSVMDGLKAGGAYKDDAQVIEITRLGKFYPDSRAMVIPGTHAGLMTALTGTCADVLPSPGAVIRVASVYEFPGAFNDKGL